MMELVDPLKIFEDARAGRPGCLFCNPVNGMSIYETENFRILIDTFPVMPGHLMISSKGHYGCSGEVPEELQGELLALKDLIQSRVEQLHGTTVFYEHGRAGCCLASNPDGSKCEHFHIHCLPANIQITDALDSRFERVEIEGYHDLPELFLEYGSYLYFEDSKGTPYFYAAEDSAVESHLLRTLICNALERPDLSNWEDCLNPSVFLESYETVQTLSFQ